MSELPEFLKRNDLTTDSPETQQVKGVRQTCKGVNRSIKEELGDKNCSHEVVDFLKIPSLDSIIQHSVGRYFGLILIKFYRIVDIIEE